MGVGILPGWLAADESNTVARGPAAGPARLKRRWGVLRACNRGPNLVENLFTNIARSVLGTRLQPSGPEFLA